MRIDQIVYRHVSKLEVELHQNVQFLNETRTLKNGGISESVGEKKKSVQAAGLQIRHQLILPICHLSSPTLCLIRTHFHLLSLTL